MSRDLSSSYVNEEGYVMCNTCRRKIRFQDAKDCACCDKFVCKYCAKQRRDGLAICPKCYKTTDY